MQTTLKIKKFYLEIQKKLFYMIPEKWDRIYLYASVIEGINHLETGEMFFYYFPKGLLKKEPVNVYEVPNKFNIDEAEYFKSADELYGLIKSLRKELTDVTGKTWTNLTIKVENFKFIVEYNYNDLINSIYNSYDRHIIWRYTYLKTGISTYNKKERKVILEYEQNPEDTSQNDTYIEGIYNNSVRNVIDYNKEDMQETEIPKIRESKVERSRIQKTVEEAVKDLEIEGKEVKRNQILNYNKH